MGAIQLFHATLDGARELKETPFQNEKVLKQLFDRHLHDLTGISSVDSEHYTGSRHKRRADTLGLDDKQRPVVIEYKLGQGGAAISQGLDYLDWLTDHKGDFRELVREKLGSERTRNIDFNNAWLLCVAGEYRRKDILSAQKNSHRIELLSVRRQGESTILLEWVHGDKKVSKSSPPVSVPVPVPSPKEPDFSKFQYWRQTVRNTGLLKLFMALHDYLVSLGKDVLVNPQKSYIGFKRMKTFAFVKPQPGKNRLIVYVHANLENLLLLEGFTCELPVGSHYSPCNVEITIYNHEGLKKAKHLLQQSYQMS